MLWVGFCFRLEAPLQGFIGEKFRGAIQWKVSPLLWTMSPPLKWILNLLESMDFGNATEISPKPEKTESSQVHPYEYSDNLTLEFENT